jgi:uncharacterized protein
MSYGTIALTILGLCVFEIISSIDNAVVNADVLATMGKRWRRWFLVWGIFFGVFLVRGLLPWFIVWMANPSIGPIGAFTAAFSNDPHIKESIEKTAPILLIGGGVFLVLLFLHWLFMEPKNIGLFVEPFFAKQAAWFFAFASIVLTVLIGITIKENPMMAFASALGASAFFIISGMRDHSEQVESNLKNKQDLSDVSKLIYLEVLDASFSIDGVIGAFAFTLSVPLIIIGNGIGAVVVRNFTIRGVDTIKKYAFLKNGAMYSIFFLGLIMISESFGLEVPKIFPPIVTFVCIGYFFIKSHRHLKRQEKADAS